MYIGLINWPLNDKEKRRLFLDYQSKVLDSLDIKFDKNETNPIEIAELYIKNEISVGIFDEHVNYWWGYIDRANAIRNLDSKDILMARIALSILIKDDFLPQIGQNLSWFLELINFLGHDLDLPIQIMRSHFSFNEPSS